MSNIEVLVISNRFDFTTDYICLELKKRSANYFRLNRDELDKTRITYDVISKSITIKKGNTSVKVDATTLRAIYYRAPIYLRDIYVPNISPEEQLYRTQWTAFVRNLASFERAIWVNNPVATFRAENKILQLQMAHELGICCPKTLVTNDNGLELEASNNFIVKSLDTAILRIDNQEAFVYSNKVSGLEIKDSNLALAPIVLQEYISPKIDVRVTVIGNKSYSVKILQNGKGIDGDWRKQKDYVQFVPFQLPENIEKKCIALVNNLGLAFGALDLIESRECFYFLEVNPTGEWAWLVNTAGLKIYEGICDYLEGEDDT